MGKYCNILVTERESIFIYLNGSGKKVFSQVSDCQRKLPEEIKQ